MEETPKKKYDLEERTYLFARDCRDFVRKIVQTPANKEYGKQLIRSSGSQAANYIEANEALGKKDFAMRVKICRKEAKESCLWLRLCDILQDTKLGEERSRLLGEAGEPRNIFTAILRKTSL